MDSYSYKVIDFFNRKIQGVLRFSEVLKNINIFPEYNEAYGKSYYKYILQLIFKEKTFPILKKNLKK